MKKQQGCYIYTRVSTSIQVDGYSLDAQKDKLHKYVDYQDMIIAGEYSDEGKSGKSVEGKPQFQQMLGLIDKQKQTDQKVNMIQKNVEQLSENFISEKDVKNFVIYKGQKLEADI